MGHPSIHAQRRKYRSSGIEMKKLFPIRLSHTMNFCSVGAIFRGPDTLLTIKDITQWTDASGKPAGRLLLYVERVRAALNIAEELREPPIARESVHRKMEGISIPVSRFPAWAFCPKCDLLHYLPALGRFEELYRCRENDIGKCNGRPLLKQVPYVLVHEQGHMDDVPWHYLAHSESRTPSQIQCRNNPKKQYLRLEKAADGKKSRLSCELCGAKVQFDLSLKKRIRFMRRQPWLKESIALESSPIIMKANDIRVHLSIVLTAIVIPPESRIVKNTIVDRLYTSTAKRSRLEKAKPGTLIWRSEVRTMAGEFNCSMEEIESAWKMISQGYPLYGKLLNITPAQLLEDEYKALIDQIPDMKDDEDFVTRHYTQSWQQLGISFASEDSSFTITHTIDRIVAVTRLKEIMVFKGFKRVDVKKGVTVRPDIEGNSGWLPAVELFGEGIFITIDKTVLENWENLPPVASRAEMVRKRWQDAPETLPVVLTEVSARFLLLHTLSHLLIRQLECDCGYPAASLKERIYCKTDDPFMAGILIYVAVPDVAGSLGGIAEIAEPRRFLALASAALARAQWCSLDPVCSEHEGQGMHLLNRAACHACVLVPEPACSYNNMLLDRVFIKGDIASGIPFFLDWAKEGVISGHGQTQI
jgi:hypothetical protein